MFDSSEIQTNKLSQLSCSISKQTDRKGLMIMPADLFDIAVNIGVNTEVSN
jgi:hypothetical protein